MSATRKQQLVRLVVLYRHVRHYAAHQNATAARLRTKSTENTALLKVPLVTTRTYLRTVSVEPLARRWLVIPVAAVKAPPLRLVNALSLALSWMVTGTLVPVTANT